MRTNSVMVCLAATLLIPTVIHAADSASKPNLVYIIAADLGHGDVRCLNSQRGKIATPNLDRLAREGMTFTDAHGGSSVCTPTRYGVLTGRYAWSTRLQRGMIDGNQPPLIAGAFPVPGFAAAGATAPGASAPREGSSKPTLC
jgi:hypothetical protein